MNKVEALLKQYELIQNYTFNTIPASKNSILSFGLAILGAIFTGNIILLSADKYALISILIFIIILPLSSMTIMFVWLGEVDRIMRAGAFLLSLEKQINRESDEEIFNWEKYIRFKKNSIMYPDIFALCIFLGTSFFSIIVSLFIPDTNLYFYPILIFLYDILFHIILVVIILKITKKFRKLQYTQIK